MNINIDQTTYTMFCFGYR